MLTIKIVAKLRNTEVLSLFGKFNTLW